MQSVHWVMFVCVTKTDVTTYMHTFQPVFFPTWHAYRRHWLLSCCTAFTDLDLGRGSQDQHKAIPVGLIFQHIFLLIRMIFDVVFEQFKLNILTLLLSASYKIKGNNCCISVFKNFNIDMHSDVYEPIRYCFAHGPHVSCSKLDGCPWCEKSKGSSMVQLP